jgi:hypothetical protein
MEKFYLEKEEELFSIIDKIKLSQGANVALVVPLGMLALKSIINLRILKEECIFLGKNIYIATSDALIKKLSQQAGIEILEPQTETPRIEKSAKMGRIVDLRQKAITDTADTTEELIFPRKYDEGPVFSEPLPIKSEKIKKVRHFKFPKFKIFAWVFVILCVLGLLIYLVLVVMPRTQITIYPKKESIKFDAEITVDKNTDTVDSNSGTIPGQLFNVEEIQTKEFPATGEKEVEEKASGKIMVYNQYSSSSQTLVKTTRFRSSDGKIFRLVNTTTIPGASIEEGKIIASSKEVDVAADEAGEAYNIGPTDFTIPGFEGTPKYTAFYGKSTEVMAGGAKGKMKVATADDISGAINIVTLELKDKVSKEFEAKIPKDLKLLKNSQTLEVVESKSSLKANQPGQKFTISIRIKASGIAFKEQDALYCIEKNVSDKISGNKTILLSTIKIDYSILKLDLNQGKAIYACNIGAEAALNIDEQKIKSDLAGKSETEVKKYLSSLPEIESAKVVFWPFWVKKVPENKNKIKVLTKIN